MNTRTTIILLVLAIALGASMLFLFNQEQKAAQNSVAAEPKAKDLFEPKPAAIVQIRVEQPDRPARLFQQQGDDWVLTEPLKARVQKTTLQEDARALGELLYVQKYEAGAADRPSEALTGLAQPNLVLTIKDQAGATHTLKAGNVRPMTEDETYVARDNDTAVYVVKQNLLAKFARPLNDYRERRVVALPLPDITRVRLAGAQNYELVKAGEDWLLEQPVRSLPDRSKVDSLLQAAANLTTENFVADDDKNLRIYGLADPQLTLTVVTEKKPVSTQPSTSQPAATQPVQTRTTTILVGGKAGTQYFAKLADEPSIFQISDTVFKSLNVPLLDLRDKAIARVDPAKVKALDITVGSQSVMLARQNGRWQMAGDIVGPAETSSVDELVKAFANARATAFEDQPRPELTQYGFESPRVRIRVISEGKVAPAEILVGSNTPSGEMVFVRNVSQGEIAVLKKPDAEALIVEPTALLERSIFSFPRDDAATIEITRDGQTTTLARQGPDWRMTTPVASPADHDAVTAILADLSSLRARKVVAISQDEKFGLTQPTATVKVHVKDLVPATQPAATHPSDTQPAATQPVRLEPAEKVYTLLVSRQPGGTYARLADGTWVYEIDPVVNTHLTAELHDRAVMKFDLEQVASVKVPTESGEPLEFVKKGDTWTYLADPFVQIDPAKLKEWISLLHSTRADRYVALNMHEAAGFGLDKPLYEAQITLASGKAAKLVVAKPTDSGKYIATVAGTTAAFEIAPGYVKQLQKPLSFFKGQ